MKEGRINRRKQRRENRIQELKMEIDRQADIWKELKEDGKRIDEQSKDWREKQKLGWKEENGLANRFKGIKEGSYDGKRRMDWQTDLKESRKEAIKNRGIKRGKKGGKNRNQDGKRRMTGRQI